MVKTMTLNEIKEKLSSIHNGSMFRVAYKSEPKVKAIYSKKGISVVKFSKSVVRTGVNYNNMKAVIAKRSAPDYVEPAPRENNNEWIVPNKILFNTKTNKYSVRFGLCGICKPHSEYKAYDVNGNEIPFDKDYVIDSYWTPSNEKTPIINLKIDNIISIG